MVIKLSEGKLNTEYCVVSVLGTDNVSMRIKELGFTKNTKIMITHFSMLGGTAIVKIRGYFLCLKKSALSKVLVK